MSALQANDALRQIVLDTETTGLDPAEGHRIIEIGAVELIDRRVTGSHYHCYINPEREVDQGALEVHGIDNDFLADKPTFAEEVDRFLEFVRGAELIIHNAEFDVGFINHELGMLGGDYGRLERHVPSIIDTLLVARKKHPGQRVSLDALCRRYGIDNSSRQLHGALLDSEILADVYLALTGGQSSLVLASEQDEQAGERIRRLPDDRPTLPVIEASEDELAAHAAWLEVLDKASDGKTVWRGLESA
ncbi:MAG: DNA polymerase III subunit epsilon [Halothiobacillaceae bacterium]